MNLPGKVSAVYSRNLMDKRLAARVGIDWLFNTTADLRYHLGADYTLNKSNRIGIVIAYGGFTALHGGLNYVHLFPKKFRLELGSNYLFSMINYKKGLAQGGYLAISKGF
jgi:hypothetical protein